MRGLLLVGTYTEEMPHVLGRANGVVLAEYDGTIGAARTTPLRNPSWLTASPDGERVYAVVEAGGGDAGEVAVLSVVDGALLLDQRVSSAGREPAHLALDPTGRFLLVANYDDGRVAVLPLRPDGRVDSPVHVVQHRGASAHPVRQTGPHPHQIVPDARTGNILVTDLGIDAIISYSLDASGVLAERGRVSLPAGSGPRHMVLHPDGERAIVANELASTVAVLSRAGETFVVESITSTVPAGHARPNHASAVAVTSDGGTVYVSNRGHDSIAVFSWDDGALRPIQFEPTRGRTPRDFTLAPDESLLHVGNQDSDSIVTFTRSADGRLHYRDEVSVRTPVCLVIVPSR
ncbi:lactonase family protein [Yonghaparkia sp. Root332]|uniref:lactonase family protein n=1 Tax=Yonghaparkia sp. Root332 TaxID=1736516 RepID=UPI0007015790|nr:lactonase family protein [Yonghaparkia sp. Root332]KQV26364.1 hypothetical protein ASC54_05575 [Yonghaparkia sp. Root332]